MSDTVYIGITGQTTQGSLSPVVQGSTDTLHTITVKGGDGNAYNLTGKTVTGLWWHRNAPSTVYAVTGTLSVIDAANGVMTWDKSAADVGTPGSLMVQFVFTEGGESDASFPARMDVAARGDANAVAGSALVGVTSAIADWLNAWGVAALNTDIDGGTATDTGAVTVDGGTAA